MAASYPGLPGRYSAADHANLMPYYDNQQMYGSAPYIQSELQGKLGPTTFARGGKRRMNALSVIAALAVPWVIFASVFSVLSFSMHYSKPQICYLVMGALMVLVLMFAYWAIDALRRRDQGRDPTWYFFIFVTSLLGWSLGSVFGNSNYFKNMQPFYDIPNLNLYSKIDPTVTRGQQLMDAGKIFFAPNTRLDLRHSMTFKNMDTYCVVPITQVDVNGTAKELDSYDFWAVGLNCCDEWKGFRCGEFNNPQAQAGLRLMRDNLRPFYRLAVQQAEAAYDIKAIHPLFFKWMQDPDSEVHAYEEDGFRFFSMGLVGFFGFQLFAVILASVSLVASG